MHSALAASVFHAFQCVLLVSGPVLCWAAPGRRPGVVDLRYFSTTGIFKGLFVAHCRVRGVTWWGTNEFIMQAFSFVLLGKRLRFPRAFVLTSDLRLIYY